MANTPTLDLSLKGTTPEELASSARDWRLALNGLANSDMIKIDNHAKKMIETKFDDASYDKDNQNLLLKANNQVVKTVKIEASNVLLDGEKEEKFDLEKSKIVQDGLVVEVNKVKTPPIKSSGFSIDISKDFTIIVKLEKILQGNIFSQVQNGEGSKRLGIALDYQDSTSSFRLFQGTDNGWASNSIKSSANNPIAIIKNGDTITVIADSTRSFTTIINPSTNMASLGGAGASTEGSYNINAYIHYNRALSQQEIQHNINILNNPSIPNISITSKDGTKSEYELGKNDRVTLEDKVQDNFNFIENKVVQEGLIGSDFNITSVKSVQCPNMDLSNSTIIINGEYEKISYLLDNSLFKIQRKVEWDAFQLSTNATISLVKTILNNKSFIVLEMVNGMLKISQTVNGIVEVKECELKTTGVINSLNMFYGTTLKNGKVLIYNRQLTPTEKQHIFSVLNNPQSISSIETTDSKDGKVKFVISTDSYHTTMANGYNAEEVLTGIWRSNTKEFQSVIGEDITVNNAMYPSKVLSGEIEGQTVKNYVGVLVPNEKNEIGRGKTKTFNNLELQVGTYKVRFYVYKIDKNPSNNIKLFCTAVDNTNFDVVLGSVDNIGWFEVSKSFSKVPKNIRLQFSSAVETDLLIISDFSLTLSSDNLTLEHGVIQGLNSTQCIIENNGMKYQFYEPVIQGKTVVQKRAKGSTGEWITIPDDEARNTVINDYRLDSVGGNLGSVPNVCDTIDRASGIMHSITKEKELDGTEEWSKTTTTSGYFRFYIVVPDILSSVNKTGVVCNEYVYESNTSIAITDKEKCVFVYQTTQQLSFVDKDKKDFTIEQWKQYLAQQKLNGTPVVVRYQLSIPIQTKLTIEEFKAYDKYKKVIELGGVGDVKDKLELMDDGSGIYTRNTKEIASNEWVYTTGNTYMIMQLSDALASGDIIRGISDTVEVTTLSGSKRGAIYLNYGNKNLVYELLVGETDIQAKLKLKNSKYRYQLATPTITYIPKEALTCISITNQTNTLSVGESVRASSFKFLIPVTNPSMTHTLTPLNGWANTGSNNPILQAIEYKDKIDIVGQIKNTGTNQVLCNLPINLRPTKDLIIGTFTITSSGELRSSVNTGTLNVNLSYVKNLL